MLRILGFWRLAGRSVASTSAWHPWDFGIHDLSRDADEEIRPMLEAAGLIAGRDFCLAFSPERIDPGNRSFGPRHAQSDRRIQLGRRRRSRGLLPSSLTWGFVPKAPARGGDGQVIGEHLSAYQHCSSQQMARFCHELDVDLWVSLPLQHQAFWISSFRPGPGVGGHCIPIDPNYLSHQVREVGLSVPIRRVAKRSKPACRYVARRFKIRSTSTRGR